jgi:DNA-binding transcriptional LysR family regulator
MSKDHGFGHIDLRALRFLALVLERRNVTQAGEALGLSQPAASRLFGQLRRALGDDPLLVRGMGGGYVPTSRAASLMPRLAEALAASDRLFAQAAFEPASSTRRFRVATTDYGAAVVLTRLAGAIKAEAPNVSLEVRGWDADTLKNMEQGRIDLALYSDEPLPAGFHYERLFEEGFACVLRSDHPVLDRRNEQGRITPEQLAELPRVVLLYPDGNGIGVDDPLAEYGRAQGEGDFLTPYFLSGPLLVSGSDHVLCMARRTAEMIAGPANLAIIDFPEAGSMTYCTIWHDRAADDAGLTWMRQRMLALDL